MSIFQNMFLPLPSVLLIGMAVAVAACAPGETTQARADTDSAPQIAFKVSDNGNPLPGVTLRVYDQAGDPLREGVSDGQGQLVLPRAKDAVELRLAAPGREERKISLPAGLADTGGEIEYLQAAANKEFSLELPVTSGTGYAWQVAPGGAAALVNDKTIPNPDNLPGAPAVQRLTLLPASASGQVLLVYVRSWETDVPPVKWHMLLLEPK